MKDDFKDYICFTDMENIGGLNQQMQKISYSGKMKLRMKTLKKFSLKT